MRTSLIVLLVAVCLAFAASTAAAAADGTTTPVAAFFFSLLIFPALFLFVTNGPAEATSQGFLDRKRELGDPKSALRREKAARDPASILFPHPSSPSPFPLFLSLSPSFPSAGSLPYKASRKLLGWGGGDCWGCGGGGGWWGWNNGVWGWNPFWGNGWNGGWGGGRGGGWNNNNNNNNNNGGGGNNNNKNNNG